MGRSKSHRREPRQPRSERASPQQLAVALYEAGLISEVAAFGDFSNWQRARNHRRTPRHNQQSIPSQRSHHGI